jgi:hypothetical protein
MSKRDTIVAKRQSNGTLVRIMPDGSTKPLDDQMDWDRLRAKTDEEITAAALNDPDAQPITPDRFCAGRRVPRARSSREGPAVRG